MTDDHGWLVSLSANDRIRIEDITHYGGNEVAMVYLFDNRETVYIEIKKLLSMFEITDKIG